MRHRTTLALAALAALAAATASAQADKPAEGLDLQRARAQTMEARGKKAYYTKQWDLSGLPAYQPKEKVAGTIRLWGSNYIVDGNLGAYWEAAFKKFHPGVTFDYHMKTTIAAVPSLVFGVGDMGIGRKITFHELLMFQRYKDYDPLEISIATGSYDVPGWNPGFGIVVHKDNPITQLTMDQLDGIFGAERLGGWIGTSWHPEFARGPEKNIRTWGQLGLTGEWKDRPITPYGLNPRYHQATEISDHILRSSDKWAERLRIYANYVDANGKLGRGLDEDLAKDPSGIAYIAAPTRNLGAEGATQLKPALKMIALAAAPGGPYVPYTLETIRDRSYPLFDEIYAYADRAPGQPLDPKVREFLRFIVSREGQAEVMRDAKYLPLTAEVAREQLKKLDEPAAAAAAPAAHAAPAAKAKNWTAPAHRIYAQALSDEIMAAHPELLSVTFHGVPPGLDKVYTMFAGSFPERIGNPDDPDDIEVITKGITIVDPRWRRSDPVRKFVMMMPLRDASAESVGLLVLAFKDPASSTMTETDYFVAAIRIRDSLAPKIPTYASLFEAAK